MIIFRKIVGLFNKLYNFIMIKRQHVIYGNNFTINGKIKICSLGTVKVGENVRVNSGKNYNIIGGDIRTNWIVFEDASVTIGDNVGMSNSTIVAKKNVQIDNNVMIGGGCKIYDTDFHSIMYCERMQSPDPGVKSVPVVISEGAFIGANSIILKGVTIGKRSVIGADSVVVKNVPDDEIWAGNPAVFVRKINNTF